MKKSKSKKKKKQGKYSANAHEIPASQRKNNRPTISVCLIVKDEERFLENCLNSVKDIADEIIIIDTGSQDNTVSIAKRYTDKVYVHPWKDNYSEARNHYFDYAKSDWILHIDADEELKKEDIPTLLKAVKDPEADLILIPIISHLEKGKSDGIHNGERLFRNNGLIRYYGRIHERLTGYKKAKIYTVRLIHYGYDLNDDDLSEAKNQRRIRLLKMDIEENPDNPLPYHYLSCCYLYRDLYNETVETGLKAIELAEKNNDKDPIFLATRYNAGMAYYKLNDFDNAEAITLSAIELNKNHIDSYYLLTAIAFDLSKWSDVIKYGKDYLNLCIQFKNNPENFGTMVANSFSSSWKIQILMGISCYEMGDTTQSEKLFHKAISNTPNLFNALKTMGLYFYNKTLFTESREYLERAFELNKEDTVVKELLDNLRSDDHKANRSIPTIDSENPFEKIEVPDTGENSLSLKQQLSAYIEEKSPDKAMNLIQRYPVQLNVSGPSLCQIAVLYLEKGNINAAIECYMLAVEKDNNLFEAWVSLGELMLTINKLDDSRIFLEKALSIRKNDISTILTLCNIASRNADIIKIVEYLDLLLNIAGLPTEMTLHSLDDLQEILEEIRSALGDNTNYQNHIAAVSARIAEIKAKQVIT